MPVSPFEALLEKNDISKQTIKGSKTIRDLSNDGQMTSNALHSTIALYSHSIK
ncbi:hypothetical protein PanWU01x14_298760, partial [Parasponia andersonii]